MRYLEFRGEVSQAAIEDALICFRRANAPDGIFVSSPGGTFEFFSVLGPALARRGIVTLSGDVRSAAIILFLLGHRRLAYPDATFFFHEVRTLVGLGSGITVCDLELVRDFAGRMSGLRGEVFEQWLGNMRAAQAWFLDFLWQATQVPRSTFISLMRAEATLTAREAVRYGIVHEIVPRREDSPVN